MMWEIFSCVNLKRTGKRSLFYLTLFCELISCTQAFADHQKIVLMTSLDMSGKKAYFTCDPKYYENFTDRLETKFYKYFSDSSYAIEVIHSADQYDLWRVLHDPTYVAVFWLSHAGAAPNSDAHGGAAGLISSKKVVDSKGYDLAPVFEKVHPNLKFLAVIGCFSRQVIRGLPKINHDPDHPAHPYLRLLDFNRKIEVKTGLKKAVEMAKVILSIPEIRLGYESESLCPKIDGYRVQITRSFSKKGLDILRPATRIMIDSEIVGVFPKGDEEGTPQTLEFFLPKPKETNILPDLEMTVGDNDQMMIQPELRRRLDFGEFDLVLKKQGEEDLKPWVREEVHGGPHDGEPWGILGHSYGVEQETDAQKYVVQEPEFESGIVPPY